MKNDSMLRVEHGVPQQRSVLCISVWVWNVVFGLVMLCGR